MRIWFNRGYSLADIARCMRTADDSLEVIVSTGEGKPAYAGPTETFTEPELSPTDYVEWLRAEIIERDIDVFVPTLNREDLYDAKLPCAVHFPCTASILAILEDKYAFAKATEGMECHLPTLQAETADEVARQIAVFAETYPGQQVCVKPRKGVNGHGFWKLTDHSPAAHLLHPEYRNMRKDVYVHALRALEVERIISPIVIMGYLPGPEVSFDVLAHEGKILKSFARTKFDGSQMIESAHPLDAAAAELVSEFSLHGVINLQFRKAADESWKILEINARPAGGSTFAEEFGANLLADWGGLLSGRLKPEDVQQPSMNIEIERITSRRLVDRKVPS